MLTFIHEKRIGPKHCQQMAIDEIAFFYWQIVHTVLNFSSKLSQVEYMIYFITIVEGFESVGCRFDSCRARVSFFTDGGWIGMTAAANCWCIKARPIYNLFVHTFLKSPDEELESAISRYEAVQAYNNEYGGSTYSVVKFIEKSDEECGGGLPLFDM